MKTKKPILENKTFFSLLKNISSDNIEYNYPTFLGRKIDLSREHCHRLLVEAFSYGFVRKHKANQKNKTIYEVEYPKIATELIEQTLYLHEKKKCTIDEYQIKKFHGRWDNYKPFFKDVDMRNNLYLLDAITFLLPKSEENTLIDFFYDLIYKGLMIIYTFPTKETNPEETILTLSRLDHIKTLSHRDRLEFDKYCFEIFVGGPIYELKELNDKKYNDYNRSREENPLS